MQYSMAIDSIVFVRDVSMASRAAFAHERWRGHVREVLAAAHQHLAVLRRDAP